jgi:cyclic pyranopterin phosphate synthase
VVFKDSRAGAWYGDICKDCVFFPCHDALMALRLTSDGRLQFCLLREDIAINLAPITAKQPAESADCAPGTEYGRWVRPTARSAP